MKKKGKFVGEFDFIDTFFRWPTLGKWKSSGIGDDCAIVTLGKRDLVLTKDVRSITTHFLADVSPYTCGYKALAVNLSDLAAAGAEPRGFLLGLSTPHQDPVWFQSFVQGMRELAQEYQCDLLGGDTTGSPWVENTRAPLTISITALGVVPHGQAMRRVGARVGDDVWVSGTVGDAYTALQARWGVWPMDPDCVRELAIRMDQPRPRVHLGQALRAYAHACADISDGLWQDLGHILRRSHVGVRVLKDAVPRSMIVASLPQEWQEKAIGGGDDYELVWTAAPENRRAILALGETLGVRVSRIGQITPRNEGRVLRDASGKILCYPQQGFDHFRAE